APQRNVDGHALLASPLNRSSLWSVLEEALQRDFEHWGPLSSRPEGEPRLPAARARVLRRANLATLPGPADIGSSAQYAHPMSTAADRLKAPSLFGYRRYWAHRLTPAPFLPMSREEMDALGWEQCDVILVTGDAYVDHPSFGMAI